jgi:hypothetical protein
LNGRGDQSPVNETKQALFSAASNERFAIGANAERFAMMPASSAAGGTKFDATQHTSRPTSDKIATTPAVSRRGEYPRLRLAFRS